MRTFILALLLAQALPALAIDGPDSGKLLATGGVSQVEGAGGGGLTPWALITSYGTRDSWGANAHSTTVHTADYALQSWGLAAGIGDAFEVSLAQQRFTGSKAPLNALVLQQDIVGFKWRVSGDAVYDQTNWEPQVAVGLQYKRNASVGGLGALGITQVTQLGAKQDHGTDLYVSATKILLSHSLLLNGTARLTKANQMGLLGFGGDLGNRYQLMPELSAAYLLNRHTAIGLEYRRKPHNLGVDPEAAAKDVFLAWFPNRNLSLTMAYVNLGPITVFNNKAQRGWYVSLQAGF